MPENNTGIPDTHFHEEVTERLTSPIEHNPSGVKLRSVGSVQERALRMELADEEAATIQPESRGLLQKIREILKRDRNSQEIDVQREADEVVIARVVHELRQIPLSRDWEQLHQYIYKPELIVDKHDPKLTPQQAETASSRYKLTESQLTLAKQLIIKAATERVKDLEQQLIEPYTEKFSQAQTYKELYAAIGIAFDEKYDTPEKLDPDNSLYIRDHIKTRLLENGGKNDHFSVFKIDEIANNLDRLFYSRVHQIRTRLKQK